MDESELRKIIDQNLRPMRTTLCLGEWRIDVEYGPVKSPMAAPGFTTQAMCTVNPGYRQALITFDPAEIHNRKRALELLLHELMHVLHAEMYLFRDQVYSQIGDGAKEALELAWHHGIERLIGNLERFVADGLKISPDGIAQRGRQWMQQFDKPKPSKPPKRT